MTFIEWLENEGGAAKVAITIKMYVENKPKRGPGSDKVNIGQYINQGAINKEFIDSEAAAIYRRLVKSTDKTTTGYFFSPFLKTEISKGDSTDETRPVAQATVRDASVQKLLLEYIELNGPTPYRHSYAYQKNKSAKDAVKYIRNLIKDEYKWIFDADLSKYFDTIPHNGLIRLIKTHFPNDPQLESLTFRYLKSYIRPSPKGFGNKAVRKLVGKSR
ncbi:MAG: reverse transcriptase domain-containing protein, partial [Vampirovibrionales bacterium]